MIYSTHTERMESSSIACRDLHTYTSSSEKADTPMTNRETEARAFFQCRMSERKMTDWGGLGEREREKRTLAKNQINTRCNGSNSIIQRIFFFSKREISRTLSSLPNRTGTRTYTNWNLLSITIRRELVWQKQWHPYMKVSAGIDERIPLLSKYLNQSEHRQWRGLIVFSLSLVLVKYCDPDQLHYFRERNSEDNVIMLNWILLPTKSSLSSNPPSRSEPDYVTIDFW